MQVEDNVRPALPVVAGIVQGRTIDPGMPSRIGHVVGDVCLEPGESLAVQRFEYLVAQFVVGAPS